MTLKQIDKLFRKLLLSYKFMIYFRSGLKKKDKKLWIFGTYNNGFSDNTKYLFLFIKENFPNINAIWITRNIEMAKKLRDLGYPAFYKKDKKAKYFLKKAKFHFTNTNLVDTSFWHSKGAKYINLWHGIPLKKIEFDIEKGSISWKYQSNNPIVAFIKKIAFPALYKKPDYLLCPSKEIATIMKRSFRVDDEALIYYPYPRNIVFEKSEEELRLLIENFEASKELTLFDNLKKYKKKFIYLPTFRDGKKNFIKSSGIDFVEFNKTLKSNNSILIVKFHPNIKLVNTSYSNIKVLKSSVDIYPFLPVFDCLITDYSSVFFDFLLSDKEIIFYCFDKDQYLSSLRGLNYDYDSITPGKKCNDFNELLLALQENDNKFKNERKKMKEYFWGKSPIFTLNNLIYDLKKIK